jgi:TonB-linked SusC/RagA family outer membrane protein
MRVVLARRALGLLLLCAAPATALPTKPPGETPARIPLTLAATIRGRVTSQDGGQPVVSAQVSVVGTRQGATTNNNGEYSITGVAAGRATVRAIRIGFQPQSQEVTVPASGEVTVNFVLGASVTKLEEVITTATGQQSRREFGNVQSTVKADSIMKVAPATTMQEMLQARTSGVEVFNGVGVTGAATAIRIRGLSSLSLTNDPLVIVDGSRFDAGSVTGSFNTSTSRLGDLNLQEIESVDVVKGPSAAALYGTAAANGVIIVKTKRGQSGAKARWVAFGEQGLVEQPNDFVDNWRSWGHNLNSAGVPTGGAIQCTIARSALGQCHIDSLTTNNPYLNPLTSPFRDASGNLRRTPRSMYGLQASGGSDLLRYFISGSHEGETGPFVMPDTEITRITAVRGTAPRGTQLHPNQLRHDSYRGNFQIALAQNATVDVNAGFSDRTLWQPFDGGFFAGFTFQFFTAPGCAIKCNSTLRSDGTWTNGTQREFVGDVFSVEQKTTSQRFTGSASLNWAPRNWLQVRSNVGLDQSNTYEFQLQLLGEGPNQAAAWGPGASQGFSGKDFERNNVNKYSMDVGATATNQILPSVGSRTTVGVQWFKDETYRGQGQGYGFGPGVSTPNSASQRQASEFTVENATYGGFIEEQLNHRERLFGTLGVRTDQNSAFGRKVGNTVYPRASLSYVISEEDWFPRVAKISNLRLRMAWGRAGVQPGTTAALAFLTATTYPILGVETPALRVASIGNPDLKPEVTTELEGGLDAAFFDSRLNLEATVFRKISRDALFQRPLPPSFSAGGNQFQNLAKVENRGVELAVDASILRTRLLTWDVRVNGSHLKNRLVTVGEATLSTAPGARNVVGYPINGLWDKPILSFNDANGDGILVESEIVVDSVQAFRGPSLPQYEGGLTNNFGFFNGALRIMTLFDYRGKYFNNWAGQNQRCVSTGNCRSINDPTAPLEDQAAAVMGGSSSRRTLWGFFVPSDFIRFREASASYNVPKRFTDRYLRGRQTTFVVSGRNLGLLMNKFPGLDPEANSSAGTSTRDFFSEPPLRYFIGRVNVAF